MGLKQPKTQGPKLINKLGQRVSAFPSIDLEKSKPPAHLIKSFD